ncbi:hypothetical protein JCM10207_003654 [Rhodosporidiobolus poonsookiae]
MLCFFPPTLRAALVRVVYPFTASSHERALSAFPPALKPVRVSLNAHEQTIDLPDSIVAALLAHKPSINPQHHVVDTLLAAPALRSAEPPLRDVEREEVTSVTVTARGGIPVVTITSSSLCSGRTVDRLLTATQMLSAELFDQRYGRLLEQSLEQSKERERVGHKWQCAVDAIVVIERLVYGRAAMLGIITKKEEKFLAKNGVTGRGVQRFATLSTFGSGSLVSKFPAFQAFLHNDPLAKRYLLHLRNLREAKSRLSPFRHALHYSSGPVALRIELLDQTTPATAFSSSDEIEKYHKKILTGLQKVEYERSSTFTRQQIERKMTSSGKDSKPD